MPDKPWKAWEREVAALIGGERKWANSGALIDCEGPTTIAQCKLVARLSLEELTRLAEMAGEEGTSKGKLGIVAVKVKRGKGFPSPGLIVMTVYQFQKVAGLYGADSA